MPRFMVYYSTGEWGKAYFDAENIEHAEELLQEVMNGDLSPDELPAYNYSIKGGDGWEYEGLTEMEAN